MRFQNKKLFLQLIKIKNRNIPLVKDGGNMLREINGNKLLDILW